MAPGDHSHVAVQEGGIRRSEGQDKGRWGHPETTALVSAASVDCAWQRQASKLHTASEGLPFLSAPELI